jgi:hypothetical protein
MLKKKRLITVLTASIMLSAIVGAVVYFVYYSGKALKGNYIGMRAYKNSDADTKLNASTNTLEEFSSTDQRKVEINDTDNTEYVAMRADQDDWDGMHFVFDLGGYDMEKLASIRFTWIGRIIDPDNCDCMELWYYKDSGWVKFDDINQSVWMTKTENWTSNLTDYVDANGKVHISVLIHVKTGEPLEVISAYLLTQFVNLEVSYIS